ncbi:MAG: STAS domain-containing protein [Gemmatimonadetes bacterium]|nr:MAG: STAS domain-containing protein [Gemmatimonadota bacterium]
MQYWTENLDNITQIYFDLYQLRQLTSVAIGHLIGLYSKLNQQKIQIIFVVNPRSAAFETLDLCGFFDFANKATIQETPLNEMRPAA